METAKETWRTVASLPVRNEIGTQFAIPADQSIDVILFGTDLEVRIYWAGADNNGISDVFALRSDLERFAVLQR